LEDIKDFISDNPRIRQITVVGDRDVVGQRGAMNLLRELYGTKLQLAVLEVPTKDMREWYTKGGATYNDVIQKVRCV
jgi:hypothetical protein